MKKRIVQKSIKPKEVSERLEAIVKKSGLKQYQFADKCKITAAALSTYLNKDRIPESEILSGIARFGKTSMEWILTGKTVSESVMENEHEFNEDILKHMAHEIKMWRNRANEVETILRTTQEISQIMESGGNYKNADPKIMRDEETTLVLGFQDLPEDGQKKVMEYLSDQVQIEKES
jgi:transcriptional regulator with XRE-family HTH domain